MSHPKSSRDDTTSRAADQSAVGPLFPFGLRLRLATLVAALGIVAAACGPADRAATAAPGAATEAALLAFAQCMRDQGIDDMPDPTVDSEGNVRIQRPPGDLHDDPAQHDRFEAARDACAEYLEGITQGFNHADDTKAQDQLLQLAQCLRGRGVDVPDPDFSGGGHGSVGDSIDRSDPRAQDALRACQQEVFGSEGPGH